MRQLEMNQPWTLKAIAFNCYSNYEDQLHCSWVGSTYNFNSNELPAKASQTVQLHLSLFDNGLPLQREDTANVQNLIIEIIKPKNSDSSWKQEMEMKIDSINDRKIEEKLAMIQNWLIETWPASLL